MRAEIRKGKGGDEKKRNNRKCTQMGEYIFPEFNCTDEVSFLGLHDM